MGFGDEDTNSNNKGVPLPPPPQEEERMDDDEQKKQSDLNSSSKSYASYRSAMSLLSETPHHPLAIPSDSDPLLSPLPPPPRPPYPDVETPPPLPSTTTPTDASGNYSSSTTEEPPHPLHFRSQSQFDNDDNDFTFTSPSSSRGDLRNGGGGRSSGNNTHNNNGSIQIPNSISWAEQSSSCSSQEYYMFITVSNPRKEQETSSSASSNNNSFVPGGNTHVSYLITTRTNIPEFGGSLSSPLPSPSEFHSRRRFKDVVNLSQLLSESFRGFFIPPRPDKSVVESQVMYKQEFVEQRREALEKYLRRLAAHPAIRRSNELRAFLQVHGALLPPPSTVDETPSEVMQPAKRGGGGGGRDLLKIIKELKQSVANDWVGSRSPAVVQEDKVFLEKKEKLLQLEQQLSNTTQQSESLVKAQQDIGQTMGELGLAFIKLAKFENGTSTLNSQRIRAADMKAVATASVKASRLYRELNTQTVKHADTLHEYLGFMLAVHSALSYRSSALLTVQTLASELLSLHKKAEKLEAPSSNLFGGDKTRPRKIEELKETMRVTENAKQCAFQRYQQIKENNKSEIERFDRERRADFLNMLKGLATNQVDYAEKIADVWTKVAEETSYYAKESGGTAWL